MGRRVKKTKYAYDSGSWTTEAETLFVYNGWNLIQEIDNSNTVQKAYVWGLDLSQSSQGAGGIGGLIAAVDTSDSSMYLYNYDANGNVGQLVDGASGEIKARYEYDPFGKTVVTDGDYAEENAFRFSTKFFDNESGLYYYGYRYYDAELGRWISRDPINELGNLIIRNKPSFETYNVNLYGFVLNDPVNLIDILGLNSVNVGVAKALAVGDLETAIALAGGTVSTNIIAFKALYNSARLGQCHITLKRGYDLLKCLKLKNVEIIKIVNNCGAPNVMINNQGYPYHYVLKIGNRVFDAVTKARGMPYSEYKKLLDLWNYGKGNWKPIIETIDKVK